MVKPISYIQKLISEGEHQTQDFKFGITDSRKIARTLSAFANTDGGRLLIGVKDNGSIAGVRSDEEFYMIQAASQLYTRPEVPFQVKEWKEGGKSILEITIDKGDARPYLAPDKNGKYVAYVRVDSQNFEANAVLLKVWKQIHSFNGAYVELSAAENRLLEEIRSNGRISISQYIRNSGVLRFKAIDILANLVLMEVIEMEFTETGTYYRFKSKVV